ncbi:MAG TPA: hypothetical protein VG889_19000 [Rhizomicrobium sp.]|nr:hypothetical protein [Rhizomicrobium sp.]
MGALTLARLIAQEASRRPRAVLATIMLALSAGFIILPDPGAAYATMSVHDAPLVYTPAVMGVIAGEMFVAFAIPLVMLAMSMLAPLRIWRAVLGVAGGPGWKPALGLWVAGFGAGLFLLSCIFGGALLRASGALGASGSWPAGLWIFFTWSYGLGVVGAAFAAMLYSVLALRLATRPGLLMGATFIAWLVWLAVFGVGLSGLVDVHGQAFAVAQLLPQIHAQDLSMGFIFSSHKKAAIHARDVADLISVPGAIGFLAMRAALVGVALLSALALAGPRVAPLAARSRTWTRPLAGFAGRLSARFGLTGVILGQVWSTPLWALVLLVAAVAAETVKAGEQTAVVALGFAWGLTMLRWPELCEAFEQGGLRSLVRPSVLGPWPVRFRLVIAIALQMSVLALPLAVALAASGRVQGLAWLATQIVAAPLLCVGLARLRGGATAFSLLAMAWWYLMVSGNAQIPPG